MAETRGKGGSGWLWLLSALVIFIGTFLLAVASIFPEGVELRQPVETTPVQVEIPIEEEVITVELDDIVSDPSPYFGKDVVAVARVTDIISDRALWLSGREDASIDFFAVVAKGIDLRATDFRVWQLIEIYGTVRQMQEEDFESQGVQVGPRTTYTLSTEKAYLVIKGLIPTNPQRWQEITSKKTPTPSDEETAVEETPVDEIPAEETPLEGAPADETPLEGTGEPAEIPAPQ